MNWEVLLTTESLISFFVLVVLEVVLGIDNVIFVSIIMNKLKNPADLPKARKLWMLTGIIVRSILLLCLGWLLRQKDVELFSILNHKITLPSLVMLVGGGFLIFKTVKEIHHKLEGEDDTNAGYKKGGLSLAKAVVQIMIIDAVFSFDSVITAGGTAEHVEIMIAAVIIAMIIMFLFAPKISSFIQKHPTLKMLALSFLVMIGLSLIIEGWDPEKAHQLHLKNYIYFGMAFSFGVEILNLVMRGKEKRRNLKVVEFNEPQMPNTEPNQSDEAH
jgi:predicted tellurium resistance membrane protein TerC